jgi:hypothetical protein
MGLALSRWTANPSCFRSLTLVTDSGSTKSSISVPTALLSWEGCTQARSLPARRTGLERSDAIRNPGNLSIAYESRCCDSARFQNFHRRTHQGGPVAGEPDHDVSGIAVRWQAQDAGLEHLAQVPVSLARPGGDAMGCPRKVRRGTSTGPRRRAASTRGGRALREHTRRLGRSE